MTAAEFAKTHSADSDWVSLMDSQGVEPIVLSAGQRGSYSGFPATVERHYRNGMYEIRTPGGTACVSASHFIPE